VSGGSMGHLLPNPIPIPIPLFLLILGVVRPVFGGSDDQSTACESLEINNIADFRKLENCTHVVGHIRLAYVDLTVLAGNYSFESLATNVTEISDYLMVYRCTGLITLQSIFPRLKIIRGRTLLFDEYGLVVYENRNLREVGLVELLRIQKGSIRIESNPQLCFVETVDWVYLMGNSTQQHFSLKVGVNYYVVLNLCSSKDISLFSYESGYICEL